LKVTYTEEAIGDIVEAIAYLKERIPPPRQISTPTWHDVSGVLRLTTSKVLGRACGLVRLSGVGQFHRSGATLNRKEELTDAVLC